MQLHLPTLLGSTHPEPPVDVGVVCLDGICSSSMLGTVRRHVRPRAVPPSRLDVASWEHGPALRGGAGPQPLVDLLLCQRLRRLAAGGRRLRGRGRGGDDWEGRRGGGRCARGLSGHFLHAHALRALLSMSDEVSGGNGGQPHFHRLDRSPLDRLRLHEPTCSLLRLDTQATGELFVCGAAPLPRPMLGRASRT